ncbi:hypothetical protein SAMN05421504_101222 [Amycolatopsis xylanica]|uniref:Uncharacterized protein n=1 Tax=Amycolatopsis xylanica TaxID=589385 RepID=A0A1H2SH05_9PSEU|nr:hypothetical protein SAMN05421504_101222 [Amycolatopsis xylanica]
MRIRRDLVRWAAASAQGLSYGTVRFDPAQFGELGEEPLRWCGGLLDGAVCRAHLRVGPRDVIGGIVFLATAAAALTLGLIQHGVW